MKLMFDHIRSTLKNSPMVMKILSSEKDEFLSGFMSDKIQKFMLDNIERPPKIEYKDVPNMAPPYEEMWFEWADNGTFSRIGVHVHVTKQNNTEGWKYWLTVHVETQQGVGTLPYMMTFSIPPSGRAISLHFQYFPVGHTLATEKLLNRLLPVFSTCAGMVIFAIGLLHCKNIVQIEKGGKNPNIKNRRHRSKGTVYRILNVIPARNIKRTEYEHPAKGLPQRIHFRRGHFKEYTSERPLFGKYVGAFWWEAHAAGNADIGEVKKDYRILPMQQ